MSRTLLAGKTPQIEIQAIGGDLSIVGWDGDEILLKAEEEALHLEQDRERVRLSCTADLSLRVPRGATLSVQSVEGDMALKSVMGNIAIQEVRGDLSLRDVGPLVVGTVQADLSLRAARGDVQVKAIHGDASIREVGGSLTLENVADDLALREVQGNLRAHVGEDVVLYLSPQAGNTYSVDAGEDILLVMPSQADATLTLNGDAINVDWDGVAAEAGATSRHLTLGSGAARITLNAGGEIRVTSQANAGESAEDFGNFAGIGFDWSGFGEHISQQVEATARRAARRAEEAARRIERDVSRRVKSGRWGIYSSPGGAGARPAAEPVSEAERLMILKMLEEKKITAKEAQTLLDALEGEMQ